MHLVDLELYLKAQEGWEELARGRQLPWLKWMLMAKRLVMEAAEEGGWVILHKILQFPLPMAAGLGEGEMTASEWKV